MSGIAIAAIVLAIVAIIAVIFITCRNDRKTPNYADYYQPKESPAPNLHTSYGSTYTGGHKVASSLEKIPSPAQPHPHHRSVSPNFVKQPNTSRTNNDRTSHVDADPFSPLHDSTPSPAPAPVYTPEPSHYSPPAHYSGGHSNNNHSHTSHNDSHTSHSSHSDYGGGHSDSGSSSSSSSSDSGGSCGGGGGD